MQLAKPVELTKFYSCNIARLMIAGNSVFPVCNKAFETREEILALQLLLFKMQGIVDATEKIREALNALLCYWGQRFAM